MHACGARRHRPSRRRRFPFGSRQTPSRRASHAGKSGRDPAPRGAVRRLSARDRQPTAQHCNRCRRARSAMQLLCRPGAWRRSAGEILIIGGVAKDINRSFRAVRLAQYITCRLAPLLLGLRRVIRSQTLRHQQQLDTKAGRRDGSGSVSNPAGISLPAGRKRLSAPEKPLRSVQNT